MKSDFFVSLFFDAVLGFLLAVLLSQLD